MKKSAHFAGPAPDYPSPPQVDREPSTEQIFAAAIFCSYLIGGKYAALSEENLVSLAGSSRKAARALLTDAATG